jgi:hypothetical protein
MRTTSLLIFLVALFSVTLPMVATAQSVGSPGTSWSGEWNFSSGTDRSIALQQAQVIRQAEGGVDPSTIYNTYNDSRSNYVETNSGGGSVTTDLQVGDQIGENSYAVGSMNTGSVTITVDGDGNTIDASNSAETNGCVDGSINTGVPAGPTDAMYIPVVLPC